MADMDPLSLLSLEDELSCSICLSPFVCPVTIPCGHNFCQDCLLATWKDSYSCPQCRTVFPTRPELKKNTVLSAVVETFSLRSSQRSAEQQPEQQPEQSPAAGLRAVRCDTCMEAEASHTCLTCMASFCQEHLRPHRENPNFRLHQLSEPLGDLLERLCPDHHKMMELFCSQHCRPICSLCLQLVHKGCSFITPEEQRNAKESDLRGKLGLLDEKITKNENVIIQMRDMQNKLTDSATNKKKALAAEYQQMRDMIGQEERDALSAVDHEVELGQTKIKGLMKKFTENIDNMSKAKEELHSQLSQSQTLAFLQASFDLPSAANYDPHTPQISLDSKKVKAAQSVTTALREHLMDIFKQPPEGRLKILKADEKGVPASGLPKTGQADAPKQKKKPKSQPSSAAPPQPYYHAIPVPVEFGGPPAGWRPFQYPAEPLWNPGPARLPRSHSPGPPPKAGPKKKPQQQPNKAPQTTEGDKGFKSFSRSMENLLDIKSRGLTPAAGFMGKPETSNIPADISSAEKRSELLKYGAVLTLDPRTAHKRVALSEGFTKASVSDEHTNYPDCPERFAVCSQVLTSQGFSRGRHYWEVKLSSNNFIGIGLAYSSIDRKGPTSRLGRNAQSWCVEWFNVKLSAWHNSSETVLASSSSKRVGVLLDREEGTATFYNVADRAYPFHSFVFPFTEPVYPAFWIFSSGSSISLCKLQQ